MVDCICKICERKFKVPPSDIKNGRGKYCSPECYAISRRKYNDIEIKTNHAEIIINSAKFGEYRVLIDKEDVEKCKNYKWNLKYAKSTKAFYASTAINIPKEQRLTKSRQKEIQIHRHIMDCPKGMVVDHINHNPLDNRKCNLRICTKAENNRNKINNTSGCAGVVWHKNQKKWSATIMINYKSNFLGYFLRKEDAIQARKQAEQKYFGT